MPQPGDVKYVMSSWYDAKVALSHGILLVLDVMQKHMFKSLAIDLNTLIHRIRYFVM